MANSSQDLGKSGFGCLTYDVCRHTEWADNNQQPNDLACASILALNGRLNPAALQPDSVRGG
jgi:hypothetical protein